MNYESDAMAAVTADSASGGDYYRVEKAIQFLDEHAREQPSLADVAGHLGLSMFHFQRLFHRWAGVTPKDFLQVTTLGYAKSLLRESRPVLEAALDAGLSGPGRLHDLCVALEAMTPGEYRRRGEGVTVRWGVHPTPVGEALFAMTERGVCAIHFLNPLQPSALSLRPLQHAWPRARFERDDAGTGAVAAEVSGGMLGRTRETLAVVLRGTRFQVKVWEALLAIPAGSVTTYGEVAARIGHPEAHRAAASAVGANEVSYLIPCHRVLRATGAMGGYRWGEARKRALLGLERRGSSGEMRIFHPEAD
jgi:AraC family transcriptional regulator of adaptative response/methylated-DNA-[protein]-cysteine methyltransferase